MKEIWTMTLAEKTELGVIVAISGFTLWAAPQLPWKLRLGNLLLICAVTMLVQSLIRDIYRLIQRRRHRSDDTRIYARCICAESVVGLGTVAAGLLVLVSGWNRDVVMSCSTWCVSILVSLTAGFALKDLVVQWNPWRVYRVADHGQIVFSRKHSE
jgi:hypothetical protein